MKTNLLLLLSILMTCLFACSPDCEDSQYTMDINTLRPGEQFLIKSNKLGIESLEVIFVNDTIEKRSTVNYDPKFSGFIGRADEDLNGMTQVIVNDPDCGQLILSDNLMIRNVATDYLTPESFIIPAPLDLVVPTPVAFPATDLIANAWISPSDFRFCVWFNFLDENGNALPAPTTESSLLVTDPVTGLPTDTLKVSTKLNPLFSNELNTTVPACSNPDSLQLLNHGNPVSGTLDAVNNYINFTIDRSAKGLGTETFIGVFINAQDFPQEFNSEECIGNVEWWNLDKKLMLVTSQTTGRQLILHQT